MSDPLVGITAWRRELDTYLGREMLQTLSDFYVQAVIDSGMQPIIIPNGQSPEKAARLVGMVDGLLMSGGGDVDPVTYNTGPTYVEEADGSVDRFEIELVNQARIQDKPVLAICRGLQLLNVALGGTLQQNVTSPGGVHEPIEGDPELINQRRHVVTLEDTALIRGWFGEAELKVNTLHHQGIQGLAEDLVIEGRADDGLIEAARYGPGWWAVGVQWHPERMDPELRAPLFDAFREAIVADLG